MEAEKAVTKLLCERQLLKKKSFGYTQNPAYNLGRFLNEAKNEPNPYDSRFVFIK